MVETREQARAESLMVVAESQDLALELDKLDGKIAFCEGRVLDLQEAQQRLAQYQRNADVATARLEQEETALIGIGWRSSDESGQASSTRGQRDPEESTKRQ